MKILSVFIAVLILASGFDLCGETAIPDEKVKTELSKENGKKQGAETGCSNFCHCARCCFSLIPESLNTPGFQYPSVIRFFIFSNGVPPGVQRAVWQPPQIA